jgi:hypothetical protein
MQAGTATELYHHPDIKTTLLGNLQTPVFICSGLFLAINFLLRLRIFWGSVRTFAEVKAESIRKSWQ